MIRFILLTILPVAAPYVAWYLWHIFIAKPRIDSTTGDQLPPDFSKAPKGRLLISGIVLMFVVIGTFLLVHDRFKEQPYQPIDVEEYERHHDNAG